MTFLFGRAPTHDQLRTVAWRVPRPPVGRMSRLAGDVLVALVVPAMLLAVWQVAATRGWLPYQILPPPTQVWTTFSENVASGDTPANTLISLRRVLEGFVLGAAVGTSIGVALGLSRVVRGIVDPVLLFVAQVPPLGWIPLLVVCLGVDESMKVTVIAYASAIPVLINVAQGVRDVPKPLRELGRTLTSDPWTTLVRIVLPAAVPSIFTGLREGLANAWQTMVAAEIFASTEGLGYEVGLGRQLFQIDLVLATVFVLGAVGLMLNGGFRLLESRLLRWQAHVA